MQEQTSTLTLGPALRPGLVRGVGVGSGCCVGPHRPCPAGLVVVNVWPRGLGTHGSSCGPSERLSQAVVWGWL